jgi:hypothetical protein
MIIALALGACIRAPSRPVADGLMSTDTRSLTIRFDNFAHESVRVYLIGEKREWLLGRVEQGAIAILRVPDAALTEGSTLVRLAVLVGEPGTFEAARHARALTVAQPASAILSQQWRFSRGELISLRR